MFVFFLIVSMFVLEQESLNITSPEIPTDAGITKEFDPLRNPKDEQLKTPQATQQVKSKCQIMLCD